MMAHMDDSASRQVGATAVQDPPEGSDDPDQQLSNGRRFLLAMGLAVLTAVTCWLFGHLPWVLSGFSWTTTEAAPVGSSTEGLAGVRLTVPLVASFLPSLVAFAAIGAVAAALLPLVLTTKSGHRLQAIAVVLASLLVTTVVVTLLARSTIQDHASDAFAGDSRVLLGLVLVVFGTTAVGATLGTLSSVQVGFLPLAAALAAGQLPVWVEGFLVDRGSGVDAARTAEQVSHWLVLVVLAVAFALSVRRSPAWILLWPFAIAMVWAAVPFRVMTTQLAGQLRPSAGLPDTLPDILDGGVDVFRASFWEAPQARWPWLVAVLLALLWTAVDRGMRRSRAAARR
jgi:hypothetical protein